MISVCHLLSTTRYIVEKEESNYGVPMSQALLPVVPCTLEFMVGFIFIV